MHCPLSPVQFLRQAVASVALTIALSAPALGGTGTKLWDSFSGDKALEHVRRLVDLGPRPTGSAEIEKARVYIEEQLRNNKWSVERQSFTADTPRGKITFIN